MILLSGTSEMCLQITAISLPGSHALSTRKPSIFSAPLPLEGRCRRLTSKVLAGWPNDGQVLLALAPRTVHEDAKSRLKRHCQQAQSIRSGPDSACFRAKLSIQPTSCFTERLIRSGQLFDGVNPGLPMVPQSLVRHNLAESHRANQQ